MSDYMSHLETSQEPLKLYKWGVKHADKEAIMRSGVVEAPSAEIAKKRVADYLGYVSPSIQEKHVMVREIKMPKYLRVHEFHRYSGYDIAEFERG